MRQLTLGGYETDPAWSPDGTMIMFDKDTWGADDGIYVIGADGPTGSGTLLVANGRGPSWSPDGSKIVYLDVSDNKIYLADATTGVQIGGALAEGRNPCWSPDGSKIVFVKNYEIWGMNADGSNQQKLTSPTGDLKDDELNWSPDGTKIVFERIPDSIWIMNADGSGAHDLTPSKPNVRDPDYQMIQSRPVGGLVIPANKLEILAPYLALAGLVAAVSAVVAVRRRREA